MLNEKPNGRAWEEPGGFGPGPAPPDATPVAPEGLELATALAGYFDGVRERLFAQFRAQVASFHDPEEIEGAFVETLYDSAAAIGTSFDPDRGSFEAYLAGVLRNKTRERLAPLRRVRSREVCEDPDAVRRRLEAALGPGYLPEESAISPHELRAIVAELPLPQRKVVFRRYWADWEMAAVARELGRSPNACYKLERRALAALRRRLAEIGVAPTRPDRHAERHEMATLARPLVVASARRLALSLRV